jgi:SAM-dependent methyltransferase
MYSAHAMTGAWIVDIAKQVPTGVALYGIDIDLRMFPSPVPSNISFGLASVVNLPSDWANSFNLINQRLLIAGLTSSQWTDALHEFNRVLVPGGRLQLCEAGCWGGGPAAKHLFTVTEALFSARDLVHASDCAPRIPALLKAAGFVDITTEKRQVPLAGSAGIDGRSNLTNVFRFVLATSTSPTLCSLTERQRHEVAGSQSWRLRLCFLRERIRRTHRQLRGRVGSNARCDDGLLRIHSSQGQHCLLRAR